jgi:hypothetical protein
MRPYYFFQAAERSPGAAASRRDHLPCGPLQAARGLQRSGLETVLTSFKLCQYPGGPIPKKTATSTTSRRRNATFSSP